MKVTIDSILEAINNVCVSTQDVRAVSVIVSTRRLCNDVNEDYYDVLCNSIHNCVSATGYSVKIGMELADVLCAVNALGSGARFGVNDLIVILEADIKLKPIADALGAISKRKPTEHRRRERTEKRRERPEKLSSTEPAKASAVPSSEEKPISKPLKPLLPLFIAVHAFYAFYACCFDDKRNDDFLSRILALPWGKKGQDGLRQRLRKYGYEMYLADHERFIKSGTALEIRSPVLKHLVEFFEQGLPDAPMSNDPNDDTNNGLGYFDSTRSQLCWFANRIMNKERDERAARKAAKQSEKPTGSADVSSGAPTGASSEVPSGAPSGADAESGEVKPTGLADLPPVPPSDL